MRDPLFAELANHAWSGDVVNQYFDLEDGVRLRQAAYSVCGVELTNSHDELLYSFLDNGRDELPKNHIVPSICYRPQGNDPSGFTGFDNVEIVN